MKNGKATSLTATPVVLIAGEPGGAKSSVMVNSGVDPELIAGRVYQNNVVAATRTANVWYANGVAFVEAGGALTQDKTLEMVNALINRQLDESGGAETEATKQLRVYWAKLRRLAFGQDNNDHERTLLQEYAWLRV